MARLPTVGGDYGNWGTVLNEYLGTAHNADGTLKLDVKTIADLKAIDVATLTDKQQALVAGYYAPGDGGGGEFYYDAAASEADNSGTIIAPTAGSGRWKRLYSGTAVNVQWFGLRLDGSDETAALQAIINALTDVGGVPHKKEVTLLFPGEQASIKLVPVSGDVAITALSTRFVGEGCIIDLSSLTADQIGIDLGNHDGDNTIKRWERGAVIEGFEFVGSASRHAWGIKVSKPYQYFKHITSTGFKSLFQFQLNGAQGPYMCNFEQVRMRESQYGIYWPPSLDTSGAEMSFIRCDFALDDVAVYVDSNISGGASLWSSWNFTDCTFDNCKQYHVSVAPTLQSWDRKVQFNFVNCWFEQFLREGSTYSFLCGSGTYSFLGCKWVENGAWTAESIFSAGYNVLMTFVSCQFDLVGAVNTPVGTAANAATVVSVNSRCRENSKFALTAAQYYSLERRSKMLINVPTSIPWQTVTASAALAELGDGNQHGVLSLNNYNKITLCAYIAEAGPAGSYLGLQVKKGADWKWLDDIAGTLTTGTSKISLASTGMVTAAINIKQTFFSIGSQDTHEYRLVTYGGDGVVAATLSDLSVALEG